MWAILESDSPAPVKLSDDKALADILSAAAWDTLSQNRLAKPLQDSWPLETERIKCFVLSSLVLRKFVTQQ